MKPDHAREMEDIKYMRYANLIYYFHYVTFFIGFRRQFGNVKKNEDCGCIQGEH
jgi:hypothetical protein